MKASALPRALFSDMASNDTSEKNFEKKGSIEDCPKEKCQFPKTCEWNNKCMQKELILSISAKKTLPNFNAREKAQET